MVNQPPTEAQPTPPGRRLGRAISLNELSAIAVEVRELIQSGQEHLALEQVRNLRPADMGLIIAGLPGASRDTLLRVMSPDSVAWMLRQMNPVEAARVGTRLGVRALTFVLQRMHPQQALATLRQLPLYRSQALAETLDAPLTDIDLIVQTPDTAGSLTVAEYPSVSIDGTADDARNSIRSLEQDRLQFTYVFVVGAGDQLVGQIPMVELALAEPDAPIESLSVPIVASVSTETEARECARLRRHYNLTQLPVVHDGRLIGVIAADALLGALVEQNTKQMLQVASVAGESMDGPMAGPIRTRLPWLTVNLATTFLVAATIALFESTLAQLVVLAAFLPVVAGQGVSAAHRHSH